MTQLPDFSDLTPPPKLVREWRETPHSTIRNAYRAGAQHGWQQGKQTGADEELEACIEWLQAGPYQFSIAAAASDLIGALRTARRPPAPKVPTLKKQALACLDELAKGEPGYWRGIDTIRRALEGGEGEG